jgi:hypothetical protein
MFSEIKFSSFLFSCSHTHSTNRESAGLKFYLIKMSGNISSMGVEWNKRKHFERILGHLITFN